MTIINYKLSNHSRLLEFLKTMQHLKEDTTIIITEDHEYLQKNVSDLKQRYMDDMPMKSYGYMGDAANRYINTQGSTSQGNISNNTLTTANGAVNSANLEESWIAGVERTQLANAARELDRRNTEAGTTWVGDLHSTFGEFSTTDARTVNETSSEGQNEEIRYSRGSHRLAGSDGTGVGSTITTTPSNTFTWVEGHNGVGRTAYTINRNLLDPIERQLQMLSVDESGIGGANLTQLDPTTRESQIHSENEREDSFTTSYEPGIGGESFTLRMSDSWPPRRVLNNL